MTGDSPTSARRTGLLSALAALAFALAFQGSRPIWDPDEGRYVDVAIEMLRLGDVWTPHLHPEVPHFSKPPLTYWLISGSLALFGHSEWAVRLPNALAFAVTILLVAAIARRLVPGREATAAVVYATSLLPFVAANTVTTDTVLAAGVALGALGLVELRWGSGTPERARLWFATGAGLAFLTKGPPALLSLAALWLALRFAAPEVALRERRFVSLPSLAAFLLVAFAWYGHEVSTHPGLLGYLLGHEVVARAVTGEYDRNAGWIGLVRAYAPVVLAGMLPWWPLAFARRRAGSPARGERRVDHRLFAVWIGLPLVVFALAQSRLPFYLLPLATPAALLLASRLGPLPAGGRGRALLVTWIALLLAAKAGASLWPTPRAGSRRAAELTAHVPSPPCEIVFVQSRPRYSLAFYLGCDVERVDLWQPEVASSATHWSPIAESLDEEMDTPEAGRRFLVPPELESQFVEQLTRTGARPQRLAALSEYLVYRELP